MEESVHSEREKNEPEPSVKPSLDSSPQTENRLPITTTTKSCGCGSMSSHNPDETGMMSSPSYV
jgi:hypothetical protein